MKCCKFWCNLRECIWEREGECLENKVIELENFFFYLVSLESFRFRLILIESSVKLSFSRILELNFYLLFNLVVFRWSRLSVDVSRISRKTSCLFECLSAVQEAKDKTNLLAIFSYFKSPTSKFVVTVDKWWEVAFCCLIIWDYFYLFHFCQN